MSHLRFQLSFNPSGNFCSVFSLFFLVINVHIYGGYRNLLQIDEIKHDFVERSLNLQDFESVKIRVLKNEIYKQIEKFKKKQTTYIGLHINFWISCGWLRMLKNSSFLFLTFVGCLNFYELYLGDNYDEFETL